MDIYDWHDKSADTIARFLNDYAMGHKDLLYRKEYYCGVTKDVEVRLAQHIAQDWEIKNNDVTAINCGTQKKAAEVEGLMHDYGFDVGDSETPGNGGCEESIYVYLVRKGKPVNSIDTLADFFKNIVK